MDACGEFFLPDQGLFKVGLGGCLQMGGKMVRTIGRTRAGFAMTMMALCYNIKRLVCLQRTETWAF